MKHILGWSYYKGKLIIQKGGMTEINNRICAINLPVKKNSKQN